MMGWENFMGNELSKQVWNYLSKWFFIQALGRQSDTCFRIPWQSPKLCFTKLWKQRTVQPKLNGHVSSFCIRIRLVTMKSVASKTMWLLAQKTTYILCVCSRLRLLTHLNEAAISLRVSLGWPRALEVEGSVQKERVEIVEQVYGWKRAFIHPICPWSHKKLS